jgi:hypothetical protein
VAVKLIAVPFASAPASVARFEREARCAARSNPHVVAVFDAGSAEGTPFLVRE